MQPDTENENREYNTNEIADIVAIAVSTVRKYCTILEKAGYLFTKNANGYRIFKGKDVRVLTEMKNLSAKSIPLDRIADMIVLREKTSVADVATLKEKTQQNQGIQPDTVEERYKHLIELVDTLLKRQEQQEKINKELLNRLDRSAEREEQLMAAIRETLEVKRLLAITEEEKSKKGFFARLFNK
ncbi:DUF3967 domain-containing protein [Heyndrickxia oleronia]|uniref:DUF3967 domain-containing protein n=1 Tax=Heyndrickxia oleronia TaxID=38875 RepID=A0AAW6T1P9_9BACI|nr:DUF3967 domain-containing protein [Heyndrickxia oleronia]MDH5164538.1 DUF3967 domain-containing protein [Heyndrickxia oleronia]